MGQPTDLAFQVLKLEQQLEAYQKLHAEELGELWRILNECKRTLADLAETAVAGSGNGVPGERGAVTRKEAAAGQTR
jgi:hypothetical protein